MKCFPSITSWKKDKTKLSKIIFKATWKYYFDYERNTWSSFNWRNWNAFEYSYKMKSLVLFLKPADIESSMSNN